MNPEDIAGSFGRISGPDRIKSGLLELARLKPRGNCSGSIPHQFIIGTPQRKEFTITNEVA